MSITIYKELDQGSPEWLQARAGIVTASVVGQLVTPTLKTANNDTSRGLTLTLAAERITGHVEPVQASRAMERGTLDEPYARDAYAEHNGWFVDQIGFMVRQFNGFKIGFSPDGLLGDNGLIEIKSRAQKIQLKTVLADQVPAENLAQIQCGLLVSGRDWCDYVSYSGGMKLWTKRVYPDPDWHEAILTAVEQFEKNAAEAVSAYLGATADMPDTERIDHFAEMEIF